MSVVEFSMAGTARGKGRPRATIRKSKSGEMHAGTYTDAKTRRYEDSVRRIAGVAMGDHPPFRGPLSVAFRIRLEVPKSYSKKHRAAILAGEEPYYGAFDADNLAKALLDAMNHVVFCDDKQVVRLFVRKDPSEKPGVDVRVEALCEAA